MKEKKVDEKLGQRGREGGKDKDERTAKEEKKGRGERVKRERERGWCKEKGKGEKKL